MSSPRVAGLVCEGPTDVPIFREIVQHLWPSIEEVRSIQPELDRTGKPAQGAASGWSQVRAWCQRNAKSINDVLDPDIGDRIDMLVIAMDVDIAIEAGIENPPQRVGAYESSRLRQVMKNWLLVRGKRRLDERLILSTPVMAVEAWVIAALFRKNGSPEGIRNPASHLVSAKRLRLGKLGKPQKDLAIYRDFAKVVAKRLKRVRQSCSEAERTCREIEALRDSTEAD